MTELNTWTLVAETKEWVGPITVTVDGSPVSSFEVAFTLSSARPTAWLTPDADPDPPGTALGILVGTGTSHTLTVGKKYTVWTRFTDTPEAPVNRAGYVKVT